MINEVIQMIIFNEVCKNWYIYMGAILLFFLKIKKRLNTVSFNGT